MKRTKHSLSHYALSSFDMGKLYPVSCFEVMPGDTVQQATSALIRVSPLVAPVMHPVTVRVHHWFVPNRLVWDGWEDFITGGPDGLGGSAGAYPTMDPAPGFTAKDLADYFGIRPGVANLIVSALPFRAYAKIFNENYRDQDLVPELTETKASGVDAVTPRVVQNVAWEKDYFTSSRPWTQKGPEVTLPLGQTAPVVPAGAGQPSFSFAGQQSTMTSSAGVNQVQWSIGNASNFGTVTWVDPQLQANLATASAAGVNDIRRAFALQRYQEARAMYGSRYTEYLRYLGVRSSDARLQRPEYLGGGKQTISFSEVLKTGAGEDPAEAIGTMKGHGIAAMRSRRYRRFFEEHGHVISLLSVRPRTMYAEGLNRMWSRRTKEDYWQRELEHIGQQEVYSREVYAEADAAGAGGDSVFGYNDRYSDLRHIPSRVSADFRSTLNYWHMARSFSAKPVLNASFVSCDPTKRIHAVQTDDVLWAMVSHSIQARRMLGRATVGRIL